MLSFRRALVAAAFFITILYLFTTSHSGQHSNSLPTDPKSSNTGDASPNSNPGPGDGSKKVLDAQATPYTAPVPPKLTTSQQAIKDTSNFSLTEKLAYQFPYDVETKFPAYIWQTWKYTPSSEEFGDNFRPLEASWSAKHPGFIHEVITDQVGLHLIRHLYASVPEVLQAYDALPMVILKADFFRYLILLARGGIYSDIDTEALKSALDWIPTNVPHSAVGLVIGIEADPDRPDWKEWYSRRIQFCQWTIQAKSGHPVLREIVAQITQETLKRKKAGTLPSSDESVVEFTGPAAWTDVIFRFFNDERYFDMSTSTGNITWKDFSGMTAPKKVGDVVVLPITSFSPGVQQMGAGEYDDPMAFVKHEFEGTWKPEHLRHIGVVNEGEEQKLDGYEPVQP